MPTARCLTTTLPLLLLALALLGCPADDDDFGGDDDAGDDDDTADDDTADDDTADDDTADDDTADDDTSDDDTSDDDTSDDDTADDDTGDDDTGDDDTGPTDTIWATPATLDFGTVYVDTVHQQGLILHAGAAADVAIASTTVSGLDAAHFTLDDLSGTVIPAGGSVNVQATYSPTTMAAHYVEYTVTSDGDPATLVVTVQGLAQINLDDVDNDGDGYTENQGDCDDADPSRFPGQAEACNGVDDNCDGLVPANETTDSDGDGDPVCADCNDLDAALNLSDDDQDGYTTCGGDCDDNNAARHPGMFEMCNGVDDDCDGVVPADETTDGDGDGWVGCEDCDDADAARNYDDADNDNYSTCTGDCNDTDPAIHPAAKDPPNDGIDWDCDGSD